MPISTDVQSWLLSDDPSAAARFPGTRPESDPSIRARVLEDVLKRPPNDPDLTSAREQVATQGWAARILDLQQPSGQWDSPGTSSQELYVPKYIATNWRLLVLSDFGLTRHDPSIAKAVELLLTRESGPDGGLGGTGSEVCFTGNALRMLARFGYLDDPRTPPITGWLLHAQKEDGGWHCAPLDHGTLDCWEALAAFAAIPRSQWSAAMQRSVERGAEFYLDRGLVHEGDTPYAPWSRLHYPTHYYYDLLIGLDTLTRLGFADDPRLAPGLDLLESKRRPEGVWWMDAVHPDIPAEEKYQPRLPVYPFVLEYPGRPSRLITTTALAVLDRAGRS
ncbi:MAG: hypothetical protein WCA77_01980 [Thermoplasmata archaeon]